MNDCDRHRLSRSDKRGLLVRFFRYNHKLTFIKWPHRKLVNCQTQCEFWLAKNIFSLFSARNVYNGCLYWPPYINRGGERVLQGGDKVYTLWILQKFLRYVRHFLKHTHDIPQWLCVGVYFWPHTLSPVYKLFPNQCDMWSPLSVYV